MRLIFGLIGLLILGNLVVYLLPNEQDGSNNRFGSRAEVAAEKVVLLQADDIAVDDLVVGESQLLSDSVDRSLPVLAKVDGKCYRVGPFLHSSRLSLAKAQLNNINVLYTVEKRESAAAEVFRVYVGPFLTSERARAARQELNEGGVFDHFQRKESDANYIVSLGIYSRSVAAQASKERFESRGLQVRIRPEKTVLPDSYWLSLLVRESQTLPFAVLRKIDWGEYSTQFGSYSCQSDV